MSGFDLHFSQIFLELVLRINAVGGLVKRLLKQFRQEIMVFWVQQCWLDWSDAGFDLTVEPTRSSEC